MNTRISNFLLSFFIFSTLCLAQVYGQNPIKILAIGNSFSEDAISYVDDLSKADSIPLVIANMYIGGCSLERHWENASTNKAAYSYRKTVNRVKTVIANKTLQEAITDESWDYIVFQQVSQYSGKYSTYFPYISDLLKYTKKLATNPNVEFCLHRTWAYSSNSTHFEYEYYQKNQMIMYDSIVDVTKKIANKIGFDIIIPSGTAIQNGRSSFIGDHFNRDGYHLSLGLGRYTAACCWYEKIMGKSAIGNSFIPKGVSTAEAKIAQEAAHAAILNPDNITIMTNCKANHSDCTVKE